MHYRLVIICTEFWQSELSRLFSFKKQYKIVKKMFKTFKSSNLAIPGSYHNISGAKGRESVCSYKCLMACFKC